MPYPYYSPAGYPAGLPVGYPAGYFPPYGTYAPPMGDLSGTVKWYSPDKGFGFIIPIGGGPDVYFKASDVVSGPPLLTENELVVYDSKIARGDGQTVRAVNVARQSAVMGKRVESFARPPLYRGYAPPVARFPSPYYPESAQYPIPPYASPRFNFSKGTPKPF
jgi:CspA family cold shock protein